MALKEEMRLFLESQVFKGEIVSDRKGRGGLIYIVRQNAHPEYVAYKTIQEFENTEECDTTRIKRELRSWFNFAGHPLVIRPHSVTVIDGFPLIGMSYCDGDLRELVGLDFNLTGVVCLALQIVKGMMVANASGMQHHQDIKPENLLYVDLSKKYKDFPAPDIDPALKYSVRIADFGVANAWQQQWPGGTNVYKAPEQHDKSPYGNKFYPDIFAVGLVITELFQGFHPALDRFDEKLASKRQSYLRKWALAGQRHFRQGQDLDEATLIGLLQRMLDPDPAKRPSFQSCYDQLAQLLEKRSPKSFAQLNLLFEYFDYIADYSHLEDEIDRNLMVAKVPEYREEILDAFRTAIAAIRLKGMQSPKVVIELYRLVNGVRRLCRDHFSIEDAQILKESALAIIAYMNESVISIKSEHLYEQFSFCEEVPAKKLTSDLEAQAVVLNGSISLLTKLGMSEVSIDELFNNQSGVIGACRLYQKAAEAWRRGDRLNALKLLERVRALAPQEVELDGLYDLWNSATKVLNGR